MKTTLEQDLTEALEAAAWRSAAPDSALFANVARGVRRRLRWRRAILGIFVALVTLLVGGSVPQLAGKQPVPVPPAPPSPPADVSASYPATLPDFEKPPKVTDVWPGAIRSLPLTLPDGDRYVVQAMLPGNRYLVLTYHYFAPGYRLDRPAIFDVSAGTVRELASADTSNGIIDVGIEGSDAAWVTQSLQPGATGMHYDVWTAALAGRPARKLASLTFESGVDPQGHHVTYYPQSFALAGGFVMWDRYEDYRTAEGEERLSVGIYRVPLNGGTPQLVPGTAGYRVQQHYSGWSGAPAVAIRNGNQHLRLPAGWTIDDPAAAPLIDLGSGALVPWTGAPQADTGSSLGRMECGLFGCTGFRGDTAFVQSRAGTGYMALGNKILNPLGNGRFAALEYDLPNRPASVTGFAVVVWDRKTARAALCGYLSAGPLQDQPYVVDSNDAETGRPFVTWTEGSTVKLLDTTMID